MPGSKQREQLLEFSGEMQWSVSRFLPRKNELKILVNADTETLGTVGPRAGTAKEGNSMTSTSSSTSTTTSTSTSTS